MDYGSHCQDDADTQQLYMSLEYDRKTLTVLIKENGQK